MARQVAHNHQDGQGADSGGDTDSVEFANFYNLQPGFVIECLDCCYTYLTTDRRYHHAIGIDRVKFGNTQDWTDCFLTGPSGPRGANGQFKTRHDINLGQLSKRAFQESQTYQFYVAPDADTDVIAVGVPITARLESIGMQVLKRGHITGSKLNYHNAALLELYLEKEECDSFQGTCERKGEHDKKPCEKKSGDDEKSLDAAFEELTINP